jgi:N-methylhydantoinase A
LAAPAIARELNMACVLIPRFPGMLSTVGLLLSDLRFDIVRSMPALLETADMDMIGRELASVAAEARRRVADERLDVDIDVRAFLDMRYRRQNWEIEVPVAPETCTRSVVAESFDALHERLFGFRNHGQPHEIINVRCVATGLLRDKSNLLSRLVPRFGVSAGQPLRHRQLFDEAARRVVTAPLYERDSLIAQQTITGPALVVEPDSTIYVPSDAAAVVDEFGNLLINFIA